MRIWIKGLLMGLVCVSSGLWLATQPRFEVEDQQKDWVPLFNGKDLSGWEIVGGGEWTVQEGEIVVRRKPGQTEGGWLVTKKDFADFKLRLKFQPSSTHYNSGILVRDPGHARIGRPSFNGYEIQIYQGQGEEARNTNGSIYDLARAYRRTISPGEWAEFEVHCVGDHLVSFMNGEKMAEVHSRRSFLGAVGLQLHGGSEPEEYRWKDVEILEMPQSSRPYRLMEETLENLPGEAVSLLKSNNFEDNFDVYWQAGASWELSQGVLTGRTPEEISWIFTRESFADFILSFEFRINRGGNGGVCIRFPWPEDTTTGPAFAGYECQIDNTALDNPTGSIYNLARAFTSDLWRREIHREEKWNQYRIYARGDHIVAYVNQRKTAEGHNNRSLAGRIGFQVHEPAEVVEYRNIEIKTIQ